MKKVHVVGHTHWDREWYFTSQDSLILSDEIFTNVIKVLEKNTEQKFCLDGQTSIVDDYVELNPHMKDRLMALIAEGRITIGPWFTQTDALLVDGESIIRNLKIGYHSGLKYGNVMKICYLPDTFGFNAQIPTIVKGCGIDTAVVRRGADYSENITDTYFKWTGLGGKSVDTAHLLQGYGIANKINKSPEFFNQKLDPYITEISKHTDSEHILVCSGGDQVDIIEDFLETIDYINKTYKPNYQVVESSYEEFFDVNQDYFKASYTGELRVGKADRVHRTIGGIRYDIKKGCFDLEKLMINVVEPMWVIARENNIVISQVILDKIWKAILESQAHDSLGGCVTDNVAKQIIDRLELALELAQGIINLVEYRISEMLNLSQNQILLFNTSGKKIKQFADVEYVCSDLNTSVKGVLSNNITGYEYFEGKKDLLIENPEGDIYINEDPYYKVYNSIAVELDGLGFKVFDLEVDSKVTVVKGDNFIGSGDLVISFDESLDVTYKGVLYPNYLAFEDIGNDGDTYDFSPLKGDTKLEFGFKSCETFKYDLIEIMELTGDVMLPATLGDRLGGQTKLVDYKLTLSLKMDTGKIDAKLVVNNTVDSHRLRLVFNTDITKDYATVSTPFGIMDRYITKPMADDWKLTYQEFSANIHVLDELVSLEDKYNFTLLTKGIKEYEYLGSKLYLTLLSTTGEFGKPNLEYRPGRASGDTTKKGHTMISTERAQMWGENVFEFTFIFADSLSKKDFEDILVEQNSVVTSYQRQALNKFQNRLDNKLQASLKPGVIRTSSLLDTGDLTFSSIYPAQLDGYYILRLKNLTDKEVVVSSVFLDKFSSVVQVDGLEELVDTDNLIGASDFISYRVQF